MNCSIKRMCFPFVLLTVVSSLAWSNDYSQYPKAKDTIESVPDNILTPNTVDTRLGKLNFENGMPDDKTTQLVFDNLDFQRGMNVFLDAIPVASLQAFKEGLASIGVNDHNHYAVWMSRMDSSSLLLTPNTESVYGIGWLDLKAGPLVLETPPNVLGLLDDAAFQYIGDVGNAGPDKGQGGKYLVIGPDWQGDYDVSNYTAVYHSKSYGVWFPMRGFQGDDQGATAVKNFAEKFKMYRLGEVPKKPELINAAGTKMNTIHANDYDFYHEINDTVQYEHPDFLNKETMGLINAIGIIKGQAFAPDQRMENILRDAAAVANATARAQLFHFRNEEQYLYQGKHWFNAFGGNAGYKMELADTGGRALDVRTAFHYAYTGITPAMDLKLVGAGAQYGVAVKDSEYRSFNGKNTYHLHIPANVPVENFWSVVLYDVQHRSELITPQKFPSLTSYSENLAVNRDGSIDIYMSPEAPKGKANNWIQTDPNTNWFTVFRAYGPKQAWFDQTWQLNDIKRID